MIEISAEQALVDPLPEVSVRGTDQAEVRVQRLDATNSPERPALHAVFQKIL